MFEFLRKKPSEVENRQEDQILYTKMIDKSDRSPGSPGVENSFNRKPKYVMTREEDGTNELKIKPRMARRRSKTFEEKVRDKAELLPEGINSLEDLKELYSSQKQKKLSKDLFDWTSRTTDGTISRAIVSNDDKYLVAASERSACVFDLKTKGYLFKISSEENSKINDVALSKDSKYLVLCTYSRDKGSTIGDLTFYDFNTKEKLFSLACVHQNFISKAVFTKDSKFLVTCSADKSIKVFELATQKEIHHFKDIHKDWINSIALTSDDKYIISASKDKSIKLLDFSTKQEAYHFQNIHDDSIWCITLSRGDKYIISGSYDKSVKVIDLQTKQVVHHFQHIHNMHVMAVTLSKDSKYLATGFRDGTIKVFDFETKHELYNLENTHNGPIVSLAILKDNPYLVSGGGDDLIVKMFDLEANKEVFLFGSPNSGPAIVILSDDDKYMVSAGKTDRSIAVLDFKTKTLLHRFKNVHEGDITSIAISSGNKYIASASKDLSIKVFDLETMTQTQHLVGAHKNAIELFQSVAISTDENFVVSSDDSFVKIFNIQNGQEEFSFQAVDHKLTAMRLSKDNRHIVFGTDKGVINVLDFDTKELDHNLKVSDEGRVTGIELSHNKKFLIAGVLDRFGNSIKVFDFRTKQLLHSFEHVFELEFYESVRSISIGKDNKYMVSSFNDRSFKVWDLDHFVELCHHPIQTECSISSAAISSENEHIVLGTDSIQIFRLEARQKDFSSEEVEYSIDDALGSCISEDNKYIIYGTKKGFLKVFDIERKKPLHHIQFGPQNERLLAFSCPTDSRYIVAFKNSRSSSINIVLGDLQAKEQEYIRTFEHEGVRSVIMSNDGRFIISLSNSLKIFDLDTSEEEISYVEEFPEVFNLVISRDNKHIISHIKDYVLEILEFPSTQKIFEIKDADCRTKPVTSSDGKYLVFGSHSCIKVFDMELKQMVHCLQQKVQPKSVILSSDDRYIISGTEDGQIRIIDLATTRVIDEINIYPFDLTSITISKDNKSYFVTSQGGTHLNVYSTCFSNVDEPHYISSKISNLSPFAIYDDLILKAGDPKTRNNLIKVYQDLYITPHRWTIPHILAIFNPSLTSQLPKYEDCKVPFIVDIYGKTPLHYLLVHDTIDYNLFNIMLEYILDYLEDRSKTFPYEIRAITDSLSTLYLFITIKAPPRLSHKYLNLCFPETSTQHGGTLPPFGVADCKYTVTKLPVMQPRIQDQIYEKGNNRIVFRTNMLHLDYNPISEDMLLATNVLSEIRDQAMFKLPIIENLIDHLWDSTNIVMIWTASAFSLLMILISVYIGFDQRHIPMEVAITALAGVFMAAEFIQMQALKREYFRRVWNWIDLIQLLLVLGFMCLRFVNDDHLLFQAWNISAIIIVGYLRWLSYLRLFTPTRHLIQIILNVIYDMMGFITILASILVGFSLIFLQFSRDLDEYQGYPIQIYNAYKLMFGVYDDSDFSTSQILLVSSLLFILNVVLLNLLISIIGDSYGKVKERQDLVDALSRLDIIQETIILMRKLKRKNSSNKDDKRYLIYCLSATVEDEIYPNLEWKLRMTEIKKLFKRNEDELKKKIEQEIKQEIDEVKSQMNKIEGKIAQQLRNTMEKEFLVLRQLLVENLGEISKNVQPGSITA